MFFDPFGNFGKVLVLLSNVILFAEVDEVDDRLGSEEKQRIYHFNLEVSLS